MSLEIKNLSYSYFASPESLHNVNCTLGYGINVLFATQGGAKTTFLKCIAGLNPNDCCFYNGKPLSSDLKERGVCMLFDDLALSKSRILYSNLALPLKLRKLDKKLIKSKINEVCNLLEISQTDLFERVNLLPIQIRIKGAIARLLLREADIYLIDNPLGVLGVPDRQQLFVSLYSAMLRLKGVVVYATDSISEAMQINRNTLIFNYGYLVMQGELSQIKNEAKSLFVQKAINPYTNEVLTTILDDKGSVRLFERFDLRCNGLINAKGAEVIVELPTDSLFLSDEGIECEEQSCLYLPEGITVFYEANYEEDNQTKRVNLRALLREDEYKSTTKGQKVYLSIKPENVRFYDRSNELLLGESGKGDN